MSDKSQAFKLGNQRYGSVKNDEYKRDADGQFASGGGQGSKPNLKEGIRAVASGETKAGFIDKYGDGGAEIYEEARKEYIKTLKKSVKKGLRF